MFNKEIFDERPGFESYSSVNFPYPGMPMMPITGMSMSTSNNSNCSQNMNNLENRINNLENRIQRLENNMYPKAVDYTSSYQNSMNMM